MSIIELTYLKLPKRDSKIHISINQSQACCDGNILNLEAVGKFGSSDICSNCLHRMKVIGGTEEAAKVELRFYIEQYSGGSKFLDSIITQFNEGRRLSPKQYIAAIKTFRDGHFRGSIDLRLDVMFESIMKQPQMG